MQPYWKCFKAGRYFLLPTIHWSFFQGRLFIFEQDDAEPYCIYSTERLKLKVCVLLNQKQVKGLVGIVSWKDFRLFEYVEPLWLTIWGFPCEFEMPALDWRPTHEHHKFWDNNKNYQVKLDWGDRVFSRTSRRCSFHLLTLYSGWWCFSPTRRALTLH